jgi:sulfide dehydrogenase [flavocytochrome c] flavoprotein subunit
MIERISGDQGGNVTYVNNSERYVKLTSGETIKADVINLIPPQDAGKILFQAGFTDSSGWCSVNSNTMETLEGEDVYVVGDASQMTPMPKSAFSAASQARVCAYSIASKCQGKSLGQADYLNVCFSYIAEGQAISIVNRFEHQGASSKLSITSGIITRENASMEEMEHEAMNGDNWYKTFTKYVFR